MSRRLGGSRILGYAADESPAQKGHASEAYPRHPNHKIVAMNPSAGYGDGSISSDAVLMDQIRAARCAKLAGEHRAPSSVARPGSRDTHQEKLQACVKEEQGIQKDIDKSQGLIEVLVSDIVALTLEKDETVESLQITDGTLKSVENLISALGSVIERDVVDGRRFAQPSAERKKQFNELIEQRSLLQQVLSDLASEENRLNNDIDQRKRQKVSEEDKIRRMQTDLARARERVRVAEQMVDGVTRGRVVTMSREEQIRQSLL